MDKIIEVNRLIVEFMGAIKQSHVSGSLYWFDNPPTKFSAHLWNDYAMEYHSSWDWLMPVVEKIRECGYKFVIGDKYRVSIYNTDYDWRNGTTSDSIKECVWHGCVQFIKWYNTQNK